MKNNSKTFMMNYNKIMSKGSPYVRIGCEGYVEHLKIVICTKSFTQDGLRIHKGCIYAYINLGGIILYDLSDMWGGLGHRGSFLTLEAIRDGVRGWNIYDIYGDNLKEVSLKMVSGFLYVED